MPEKLSNAMSHQLHILKKEIETYQVELAPNEWGQLISNFKVVHFKKREIIFKQTEVCKKILFITQGIAASDYQDDGNKIISRFFKKGNFCTNLISAEYQELASDNVVAITDVVGVLMPYPFFIQQFLNSPTFGVFTRKKFLELHIEAKHFISIKTFSDTRKKYEFLEEKYPEVIKETPSKYIAEFLGITPEWLSRFLKKRYKP